ncbi:hypothetical protein [Streptomyces sp. NPDC018031]|uniref:phage tail assembly protein T n=1 Tax=Streptomyces sp. NPDC018031 TaxID=3365033 RepID=UPI00379EEAE2
MTVAELLSRISSRELTEWAAYEQLTGPLGGRRGDIQAAIIAATVANSQRSRGRRAEPADFLPRWGRPRVMTPEAMWAAAVQATTALGGTITATPE